jgi:hypothetical protein
MVIHKFNRVRSRIGPNEADTELIINTYRPLAAPSARQRMQAVSRRRPQIFNTMRRIELREPASDSPEQLRRKPFWAPAFKDVPRRLCFPSLNQ